MAAYHGGSGVMRISGKKNGGMARKS